MGLPVFREPTTADSKSHVKSDPSALARSTIRRMPSVRYQPHNGRSRDRFRQSRQRDNANSESTRLRGRAARLGDAEMRFLSNQSTPDGGAEPHRRTNPIAVPTLTHEEWEESARDFLELHQQQERNNQLPPPHIHISPAIQAARDSERRLDEAHTREDLEFQLLQQRNRQLPPPQTRQSSYPAYPHSLDVPTNTTNAEIPTPQRVVTTLMMPQHNIASARVSNLRGLPRTFERPISPRTSPPLAAHERSIAIPEEERVQALHTFNSSTTDNTIQPHPLQEWQYFGRGGGTNGLGDRQRSTSPDSEPRWDTLLTTITPDPSLPSAGSSFASAAASFPSVITESVSMSSIPSTPDSQSHGAEHGAEHDNTTHCEDDSGISTTTPDASDTDAEDASDAHSIRQNQTTTHLDDTETLLTRARTLLYYVHNFMYHYREFADQYGMGHRSADETRETVLLMRNLLDEFMQRERELGFRPAPVVHRPMRTRRATMAAVRSMPPIPTAPRTLRRATTAAMRANPEFQDLRRRVNYIQRRREHTIRRDVGLRGETAGLVREAEAEAIAFQRAALQSRTAMASMQSASLIGEETDRAPSGSEQRRSS